MPQYVGPPPFTHEQPARVGVLLANIGTPDDPSPRAVRRFLAEFLGDPRVVEAPRWWWLPLLHGVILRIRPARSARAYRQIWTEQGSPLLVHSRELAQRLQASLVERIGPAMTVALGMTYGRPSIASALEQLRAAGATRLIVLPLFPQYSGTTGAPVFDRVSSQLRHWRWLPELRFVLQYYDEPAYIEALAARIDTHWRAHGRKHLLFSFHGIPKSYVLAGDPYFRQCQETARLIAERLRLDERDWSVSFQSQVGRAEWLRPYTDELLKQFALEGRREVTVACPGFSIDCLETLEEIGLRNRSAFLASGGSAYDYVPALNASDAHVDLLTHLIARHVQGWPVSLEPVERRPLERARRFGAQP